MPVHRNPMQQVSNDHWVDSKLGVVKTKFYMINFGNHRKRWGVYVLRGKHWELTTRHITLEAAVVAAQTVANRLYLIMERRRGRRIPKAKTLGDIFITHDQRHDIMAGLSKAIDHSNSVVDDQQRKKARKLLGVVQAALDNWGSL